MYVVIRQSTQLGEWLVVEVKTVSRRIPLELTVPDHEHTILAVQSAMSIGAAKVVAYCKRRDDARILAREAKRRERNESLRGDGS